MAFGHCARIESPILSLGQFAIRQSEDAAKSFGNFAEQNQSEDRIEFIESDSENPEMPNWKMATMGGKQFWTDRQWLYGWRIQRNALTGHFRLLDPSNVRHAWGTQEHCQEALFQLGVAEGKRAPTRIVVLVHGLMRTSGSMIGLGKRLESEIGATPILFEYASTRGSIAEHAAAFREWIHSLPVGADGQGARIDFVAHSMGNIVIRRALSEWESGEDPYRVYPRIGRMVMLGPPNQGAMIARRLSKTGIFGVVTGKEVWNWDASGILWLRPWRPSVSVCGDRGEFRSQSYPESIGGWGQ